MTLPVYLSDTFSQGPCNSGENRNVTPPLFLHFSKMKELRVMDTPKAWKRLTSGCKGRDLSPLGNGLGQLFITITNIQCDCCLWKERLVYLSLLTDGPAALTLWQGCTSVGQHLVKGDHWSHDQGREEDMVEVPEFPWRHALMIWRSFAGLHLIMSHTSQ